MNLEDLAAFQNLDTQNMMGQINALPAQLLDAWEMGLQMPLPAMDGLRGILFAGMGGSAIGADLVAAYTAPACPIPMAVHRDYALPAWAWGEDTLVITVSHSGNTEETIAAFEQARARGCRLLVLTTGGTLAEMGRAAGCPVWTFAHTGQPRAAVGFTFGMLLAALFRLGLVSDPTEDLREANHAMRNQQTNLLPQVPVAFNPAKRMAGQMMGRQVTVFAADVLGPVARRWKDQISEVAKSWAQFEFLPESDHNSLAGLNNPEPALSQTIALFLQSSFNHPRNLLRLDYTRQIFMMQGMNTDVINAKGETTLGHIWTLLHFGDYTSYYLAMAYGEDPTPVETLDALKSEMRKAR